MAEEPTTPEPVEVEVPAVEPAAGEPIHLPDDHPLVKAFNAQKSELAQFRQARKDAEDAAKTDAQKQAEALAELQRENETLKTTALRAEVAASKGVDVDLLSGSTKEELEAYADKLLAFRGGAPRQLPGNPKPAGPTSPARQAAETREDRLKRLADPATGLKR